MSISKHLISLLTKILYFYSCKSVVCNLHVHLKFQGKDIFLHKKKEIVFDSDKISYVCRMRRQSSDQFSECS